MSPITESGVDYSSLTSPLCSFDPARYDEALAGFCARTYLLGVYPDLTSDVVHGTPGLTAALQYARAAGLTPHPLEIMFYAYTSGHPEETDPTPAELVSFTRNFASVDPSIRLGALLTEGVSATPPRYSEVNTGDLNARMIAAFDTQQDAGIALGNMTILPAPHSLDRALRLLTVGQTPQGAEVAPRLARPHIRWCLDVYQSALYE